MSVDQMRQIKFDLIATVQSQKLDKKIFAYLLSQERIKFEKYFRSSYKPAKKVMKSYGTFTFNNAVVQKHLTELGDRLGVSLISRGKVTWK